LPEDTAYRNGNRLIFRYREADERLSGNTNELGDASGTPGKSYLFFLTAAPKTEGGASQGALSFLMSTLKSDYLELGFDGWESTLSLEVSGAVSTALENPRE